MDRAGFNPVRANAQSAEAWAGAGPGAILVALGSASVPGIAKVYAKVGLTEAWFTTRTCAERSTTSASFRLIGSDWDWT